MKIITTKGSTIARDEKFQPILYFKIGEMQKAKEELIRFYNQFHKVLETGIEFSEEEYQKFQTQFYHKAEIRAKEVLDYVIENEIMHEDRFFTYLLGRHK